MKMLLVTRNFLPIRGGMERLNWHIARTMAAHYQVSVIAPRGANTTGLPKSITITETQLSPLPLFLWGTMLHSAYCTFTWRPDLLLAGSGLTAPIVWLVARLCQAKAVAYVHGLDLTVNHPLYRWLWLPFLRRLDGIIANSHATAKLAEAIGIAPERIQIVHPGVELPTLDTAARTRFRAVHGWGERPLLLSVGRLTQRKGLLEFVEYSLPTIIRTSPDCLLLIVGDVPKHALSANPITQQDVMALAQRMGMGQHIHFLPSPSDEELSVIFQAADVHVFPVKTLPNDPEGFGMVAIEAAAHGLPTVAFATGGVVDAVADGISGRLITVGDYEGFAEAVLKQITAPASADNTEKCRNFAKQFEWENFRETLSRVLSTSSMETIHAH